MKLLKMLMDMVENVDLSFKRTRCNSFHNMLLQEKKK
jgi:hypothetical protein